MRKRNNPKKTRDQIQLQIDIKELAILTLARNYYTSYLEYSHYGKYKSAPHNRLLAEKLDAVERGEIKRLMVFMPPRHGKSMTISESFPSYFIGKNPERRVIEASYGDDLAIKFGRMNKQKIDVYGEQLFGITINKKNASNKNFGIEGHRGGMISSGIFGTVTGEGADLLIIDDPIKNRQEANSETYRNRVWDEWQNTLYTRLHPGGAVIIVLTRWHEDDLAGRLLRSEPDVWEVVSLPAEAEENDILGREPGEPLWSSHGFDSDWMTATKRAVGGQAWASLYQQRPSPAEGSIFNRKWWKYYKVLPSRFDELIQSWDCAFKDNNDSDFVVGQIWGRIGADVYLVDQVRGRMDIVATMNAIRSLSKKYPKASKKLVEDKANGPAVIQMLGRQIPGLIPVNPEGGKIVRAQAVSPFFESGNVFIPDPDLFPWVHDYVEEFAVFPNGKNDDMVDSSTQAVNRLLNRTSKADIF